MVIDGKWLVDDNGLHAVEKFTRRSNPKLYEKIVRVLQGLHVSANLRPLEGPDNSSKYNAFDADAAAREQMAWLRCRGLAVA